MRNQIDIRTEEGFRAAMQWTKQQLDLLHDGGVWVIPRTFSAVKVVSHRKLEAVMIGMQREPGIVAMMRAQGWKITEGTM